MPAPDDDTNELAKARVGTVLGGKYRLERVLGVGGMAAVFVATHLRNANRVAVKVMHRDFARDKDLRRRFLREGYAANSVGHSGTVRVLDDDVAEDDAPFLVMDLLEGETRRQTLGAQQRPARPRGGRDPHVRPARGARGSARQGDRPPRHQA